MRYVDLIAGGAAAIAAGVMTASGHTVDELRKGFVPPPLKAEMREAEELAKTLSRDAPVARGVIDDFKLWPIGRKLRACFIDGDKRWKEFFVEVSKVWTASTSLVIDFGSAPNFAACDNKRPSDIRISFAGDGAWSYVGTDSLRYDREGPSLNVDYPKGKNWEEIDKKEFAHLILHELGHAFALEHEHQSPDAKCDAEFDWSRVYAKMQSDYGWSKNVVDFNMRTKVNDGRLRVTPYDKASIMHYYFAPWMFARGTASSCYVGNNLEPSATDIQLLREAYPMRIAQQNSHLQKKADVASAKLASLNLTRPQLAKVGVELKAVLARFERPLSLEFKLRSTRGPEVPVLKDCAGSSGQAKAKATCRIDEDASQLVISIEAN